MADIHVNPCLQFIHESTNKTILWSSILGGLCGLETLIEGAPIVSGCFVSMSITKIATTCLSDYLIQKNKIQNLKQYYIVEVVSAGTFAIVTTIALLSISGMPITVGATIGIAAIVALPSIMHTSIKSFEAFMLHNSKPRRTNRSYTHRPRTNNARFRYRRTTSFPRTTTSAVQLETLFEKMKAKITINPKNLETIKKVEEAFQVLQNRSAKIEERETALKHIKQNSSKLFHPDKLKANKEVIGELFKESNALTDKIKNELEKEKLLL